jgi:L-fuconolactonase
MPKRQSHLGNTGLGEFDLCFEVSVRSDELLDAAGLLDQCPDTHFVLNHCGNTDYRAQNLSAWKTGIDHIAARPNVVCKVSGIVPRVAEASWGADELAPIVRHVLDAFGPERVMFGSDWPVCTLSGSLRKWVATLQEIVADRSIEERRTLLHDNAVKVYRLFDKV